VDRVAESDVAALISGWGREITPLAGLERGRLRPAIFGYPTCTIRLR
jgi:hypothetical protein